MYLLPVPPKITAEKVKSEVQRFWNVFSSKSAEALMEFYASESTVFGSAATRPEPGRLAATRRQREYFGAQSVVKAKPGPIEVQMVGESAAVASYTFEFHASRVAAVLGGTVEEKIQHGRATQVFVADGDGRLHIVHEHLSVPDRGKG